MSACRQITIRSELPQGEGYVLSRTTSDYMTAKVRISFTNTLDYALSQYPSTRWRGLLLFVVLGLVTVEERAAESRELFGLSDGR